MKLLLLGGTGEARQLALRLSDRIQDPGSLIYSVAGLGRQPELTCAVRSGGFGGVAGLRDFLDRESIDLVLDLTHPYAAQISRHALEACGEASVELWRYDRAPWRPQAGDQWTEVADWNGLLDAIQVYRHALFTVGSHAFAHLHRRPESQQWTVRCLPEAVLPEAMLPEAMLPEAMLPEAMLPEAMLPGGASLPDRVHRLNARGPFVLDQEIDLMQQIACDVLVCKNSGGQAALAKLQACRELQIPVLMLARPRLPKPDWATGSLEEMISKVDEYLL